jgi:hypothetical protein
MNIAQWEIKTRRIKQKETKVTKRGRRRSGQKMSLDPK